MIVPEIEISPFLRKVLNDLEKALGEGGSACVIIPFPEKEAEGKKENPLIPAA